MKTQRSSQPSPPASSPRQRATFAQSYPGKQADDRAAAAHPERTETQAPGMGGINSRGDPAMTHAPTIARCARQQPRARQRGSRRQPPERDRGNYARNDDRYNGGRDDRRDRGHEGRGAGPDHAFYRGGRLPPEYRSRQYVVDDWRGHHLSAPPRGYHWVQAGGDYVLAAIATGVIASILLNQ